MGQNKKAYATTTVAPGKSMGQIDKMLIAHGGIKTNYYKDYEKHLLVLAWERKVMVDGERMIQPIMHRVNMKELNEAQAYRALFWHLKHKFEAVEFGIVTFEEEFLPYFIATLPSGEQGTIAEYFVPDLRRGALPPMKTLGPISLKGIEEDQERIATREKQRLEAEYEILKD